MKIAVVVAAPGIPARGPSGSSAHVRGLVAGLQEGGHDPTLWTPRAQDHRGVYGEAVPTVETGAPGWPSWLARWRELSEVRAARRLGRQLIEHSYAEGAPDLILERHALWSDAGWRAADALGVPWVLEVNAPLVLERERYEVLRMPRLARRWEREVLRAAPAIVAVSGWLARWLREEHGCPNVVHVPNGVTPWTGDRARGRAALGLGADEPAVGFVGSMKPWHGLDRLAGVATALGARLVLLGTPPIPAPPGALLPGHLDGQALADAVAALDLGLAPYPASAPPWFCPLKILDYRAQGTPVIASDLGDAAALVGEGGALVPPDDADALVDAGRAWLGRRTAPWVRSWRQVGDELIAAARTG